MLLSFPFLFNFQQPRQSILFTKNTAAIFDLKIE
jgi:hypothetical protein